jgi:deoxycytidine triphosphate deaminase
MLLNHAEIKKRQIIGGAVNTGYRAASYDVRSGKIITTDGTTVTENETFILKPAGVVEVISAETVTLQGDVAGYAMVKTSLCNDGLLALNIGIIDPGYSGPVSTTLLNFSKNERQLNLGDVFLRLTFHECVDAGDPVPSKSLTVAEYERERRRKAGAFGSTFLHLDSTIDSQIRSSVTKWATWFAFALAIITFSVNFSLAWASYYLWRKDPFISDLLRRFSSDRQQVESVLAADRAANDIRFNAQQQDVERLRKRVDVLESASEKRKKAHK